MSEPQYTWSQLPSFTAARREIDDDVNAWDLFQWAIEETLAENPLANARPVGGEGDLYYFRTWEHPGLSALPPLVVVFRIERPPTDDAPGLLEGHSIFPLSELGEELDGGRVLPFWE